MYTDDALLKVKSALEKLESIIPQEVVSDEARPLFVLTLHEGATLELGRELNSKCKWGEAAHQFFTVLQTSGDLVVVGRALTDLSQMLINLGYVDQAKEVLDENSKVIENNMGFGEEQDFFLARIEEKYGWISDCKNDPIEAIKRFTKAKELLQGILMEDSGSDIKVVWSTVTTFLGRGHVLLAYKGDDVDENVRKALEFFEENLKEALGMREGGRPDSPREGFQHTWLAGCYMISGDLRMAKHHLKDAKHIWDKDTGGSDDVGIYSHYWLLLGALNYEKDEINKAKKCFEESLRIRREVEKYPSGEAKSLLGLAMCDLASGSENEARLKAMEAYRISPEAIKRGIL